MIKSKKKILTSLIILLIFFSGILTERFQIDNKIEFALKNSYDKISRLIYTFLPRKEISILIEPKEYQKIVEIRKKSLKQKKLTKDLERWSEAKLVSENETDRNIQIRLKGVFADHWSDKKQWSFKVKIKNNSKPYNDLKRFALQSPRTTSYLYEWLFMKALEKENLFSLGVDFVDLKINDSNIGAYTVVGQLSDELLKKNNKQIAPIIGFDSELWIEEQMRSTEIDSKGVVKKENGTEDVYFRVKINPIQFTEDDNKTNLTYLKEAMSLLESFRQGNKTTTEVFNTDHLAKIMALRALLGSSQFDWLDTKFYYNPGTKLLEPISKEIHVDLDANYKVYYPTWWIDSYKPRDDYEKNKDFFVHNIYQDKNFYEKYLKQLNNFSKKNYFENLIKENKKEFDHYLKMLKMNYPTKKVFSKNHLDITRIRIQDFLNPVQGLNVYFSEYENGLLKLNISNLQRLPIVLKGIKFEDGRYLKLKNDYYLDGRKPFVPVKIEDFEFNCNFLSNCKKDKIEKQKIVFKITGQDEEKLASISPYYK